MINLTLTEEQFNLVWNLLQIDPVVDVVEEYEEDVVELNKILDKMEDILVEIDPDNFRNITDED